MKHTSLLELILGSEELLRDLQGGDIKNKDDPLAVHLKFVQDCPDSYHAHCSLGWALYQHNKMDEAVRSFERSLELNPNWAVTHYLLGSALCDQGKYDESIAHFKISLAKRPDHTIGCTLCGDNLFRDGKLEEAKKYYLLAAGVGDKRAIRMLEELNKGAK